MSRAAVCPHPPLLVPEMAQGAAAELDELRAACDHAVRTLLDTDPAHVHVVGPAEQPGRWGDEGVWSWRTYGIPQPRRDHELPLALSIGAWLLDRAGWDGPRSYRALTPTDWQPDDDPSGSPGQPHGRRIRPALLCMADGTAKRSTSAPGYLDPRAEAFDCRVATALAEGDKAALLGLDADLAATLWCTGTPAWWYLATAHQGAPTPQLLYDDAPYGVGYLVATWS